MPLGGPKQRAVLAKLALALGQAVTADELIDLVWGDGPRPAQPRRTLQVYVANLRKLLRLRSLDIAGTGSDYRLVAARASVDVTTFEDLVAEAGQLADDDPRAALALHEAANELWRGRALSDLVADVGGLEAAALRLDQQHLQAVEQRLGLAVRHGDLTTAVVELEALVAAEPWREHAVVHLMVGLYRQGRQTEALAVAAATRRRLVDELGLDPSPALREAEQQILEHRVPVPVERSGSRPPRRLRTRLPGVITTFVGRREELARLEAATRQSRLITLVGTGGVGKSRLAIEAARRLDVAAVFLPLSSTDATGVVRAAITATGTSLGPGSPAAVFADALAELADGAAWLVLDNAEHVLDAVSALATEVLRAAPSVTVVVTSREPLATPGEAVVLLEPLTDADARALFTDRAGLAGRTVDLADDAVSDQVGRLCAAVDRLPLAIEMAANRLRVLQLPEMLDRIAAALLTAPVRSEISAHATMLATIDWSYRRLNAAEQAVFQRIAMFPSGCTPASAEAVCRVPGDEFQVEDVIDLIARLVDRSLVVADHRASPTRFRMLETIRQFAADRRAETRPSPRPTGRTCGGRASSPPTSIGACAVASSRRGGRASSLSSTTCASGSNGRSPPPESRLCGWRRRWRTCASRAERSSSTRSGCGGRSTRPTATEAHATCACSGRWPRCGWPSANRSCAAPRGSARWSTAASVSCASSGRTTSSAGR